MKNLKNLMRKIDRLVFDRRISSSRVRRKIHKNVAISHMYNVTSLTKDNEFAILCDTYGSDKGSLNAKRVDGRPYPHSYATFYWETFRFSRHQIKNVFECGIGTNNPLLPSTMGINGIPGASLRIWRDFFPNAKVLGVDLDSSILFSEERIETRKLDQTDPNSIKSLWREFPDVEFDLMVDDGLHTFEAGSCLLARSLHKLTSNGIYVVEDILPEDLTLWDRFMKSMNFHHEWLYFGPFGERTFDLLLIARRQSK